MIYFVNFYLEKTYKGKNIWSRNILCPFSVVKRITLFVFILTLASSRVFGSWLYKPWVSLSSSSLECSSLRITACCHILQCTGRRKGLRLLFYSSVSLLKHFREKEMLTMIQRISQYFHSFILLVELFCTSHLFTHEHFYKRDQHNWT